MTVGPPPRASSDEALHAARGSGRGARRRGSVVQLGTKDRGGTAEERKRADVKTVSRWRPRRDAECVKELQGDRKDGVHEVADVDVDVNVTVEEAGITRCDL
jgi:hypothetical protein